MTREEFEQLVSQNPFLSTSIRSAAAAIPASRDTFGPAGELAAIAVLFPVVVFVVKEIGLPWLHELKRYSELWREKFHNWVDEQYRKHGLDPEAAEAAGAALRRELESVTDGGARKSWERFAELLRREKPNK